MSWLLAAPLDLGGSLRMRTATNADIEALVDFNGAVHTFSPDGAPSPRIKARTREWMDGSHPLVGPDDFLLVEDATSGQIVSSVAVMRQRWAYAGIPFEAAQTEFVGTLPAYRRQGLVRRQMDAVHRASATAGHLLQAINGIPWYYRQFGYELTLPKGGGRAMLASAIPPLSPGAVEPYHVRLATEADLPFIKEVEREAQRRSLYAVQRTPAYWQHEVFGLGELNIFHRRWCIIQTPTEEPVGYLAHVPYPARPRRWLATIEITDRASWLGVLPTALRYLCAIDGAAPAETVGIAGGLAHPAYAAFPTSLALIDPPSTWYIRIPDEAAFLRRIAPALERRLAVSVAAGYTGNLRLNRYRWGLRLRFEQGQVVEVARWNEAGASAFTPGAAFPDGAFMHLLCGTRSLAELEEQFPDCQTPLEEERVLVQALFPKEPSDVWVMG